MANNEGISWTTYNITTCAIRKFYELTCPQSWKISEIHFGRREKNIPVVMSRAEVIRMFSSTSHFIFKVIMMLSYSTGMRMSETRNLKLVDIDRSCKVIRVRCGKGAKQRNVPLSQILLKYLELLYIKNKNNMIEYVFPLRTDPSKPVNESWIQKKVKETARNAGINKKVTMHSFRHSFATHCLEDGVNFIQLRKLLGHSSVNTTLKYVHVIEETYVKIVSPLDTLVKYMEEK